VIDAIRCASQTIAEAVLRSLAREQADRWVADPPGAGGTVTIRRIR
jgi:hypothetical protein